jgi:hypothetical protein
MRSLAIRDFESGVDHRHQVEFLRTETPSGLLIRHRRLFEADRKYWIGLPSPQYTRSAGATAYTQIIIDFASSQASARFGDEFVRAVDAFPASGAEGAHGASR